MTARQKAEFYERCEKKLPLGRLLGIAEVIDFGHFVSPWAMKRWLQMKLAHPCLLVEPVKAKGRLGLWCLPEGLKLRTKRK